MPHVSKALWFDKSVSRKCGIDILSVMFSKNHIQFLQCLSAYYDGKIPVADLGNACTILDCDDYRQAYYKAHFLLVRGKEVNNDKELELALKEVERSLFLKNDNTILDLTNFPKELVGINFQVIIGFNINIANIYFLGGQIKAMLGDYEGSLDYYKNFQLHVGPDTEHTMQFAHQRLYLFRSCSEYTIKDLINNRLTLARPNRLNDPFDCLIFPWRERLDANCEEKTHVKPLADSYDYFRIRSFVLGNNKRSFKKDCVSNQLMWSHYADEHRGICILYDFSEQLIQNTDTCRNYFMKVDYANKKDKLNLDEKSISVQKGFATKSSNWKYENEVRLISYDCSTESDFAYANLDSDSKIKAIFFGLRCSEDDMNTIRKIAGNEIEYYKMEADCHNIYQLSVKKV